MNQTELYDKITNTLTIKSILYIRRYLKLIDYYRTLNLNKSTNGSLEKHHILPVALFPEYKNDKWNIVLLPAKAHYIVHYMLYKGVRHKSCAYAFNQMRRVSKAYGKPNCRLYHNVRKEFAKLISENNKNSLRTDEWKKLHSEKMKNTNIYRSIKSGEMRRFMVGEEPDEWLPFQTGRIRTTSSKNKMSDSMKGRVWQYNTETKEVRFDKVVHNGFQIGYPDWYNTDKEYISNLIWIYDNETGLAKRIDKSEKIPIGWSLGRKYDNKGFAKINNSNLMRVVDLKEHKFCLITEEEYKSPRYIKHGSSLDKVFLFSYNNIVYSSFMDMLTANTFLPKFNKRNLDLMSCIIPKPHHNMTNDRQKFCRIHQGKTMKEIGVNVIPLNEFVYKENMMYVRH